MLKATEHSCGRVEGPEVVEGGRGWGTSALLDVAQAAWKSLVLISRRFGQLFFTLVSDPRFIASSRGMSIYRLITDKSQ